MPPSPKAELSHSDFHDRHSTPYSSTSKPYPEPDQPRFYIPPAQQLQNPLPIYPSQQHTLVHPPPQPLFAQHNFLPLHQTAPPLLPPHSHYLPQHNPELNNVHYQPNESHFPHQYHQPQQPGEQLVSAPLYHQPVPPSQQMMRQQSGISFGANDPYGSQTQTQSQHQQQQSHNYSAEDTHHHQHPSRTSLPERLQRVLPRPPLSRAVVRPESLEPQVPRRARRRSKFTREQDELIVSLKKGGKSWVDIAEIAGVGSFLAARNRYQVLIGQQGGGSASWGVEDTTTLQSLLDEGELEKWRFIARELQKATGKNFSDKQCRDVIKLLFWKDPHSFGVNEETLQECIKENDITTKSIQEQQQQSQHRQNNQHSTHSNEAQLYQQSQTFNSGPTGSHYSSNQDSQNNTSVSNASSSTGDYLPQLQLPQIHSHPETYMPYLADSSNQMFMQQQQQHSFHQNDSYQPQAPFLNNYNQVQHQQHSPQSDMKSKSGSF